tara:strand:- start:7351 stop:8826 length:1476 start_codon:yes stop_codon:yes gene_type:complete
MTDINAVTHLLDNLNYELAHDDMHEPFIIVYPDDKKMLFRLNGKEFKRLLEYKYTTANNSGLAPTIYKATIQSLEGKAIFDSDMIQPDVRLVGDYECVEIDLCDSTYDAVRITAEGFEITQPQSNFIRRHGLLPLPRPIGLSQEELQQAIAEYKSLLNVTDEQFILVIGAVLMAFHPKGPYPVLFVQGEHGSAKGSLCEAIKAVVDPNKTPHTTLPKDVNDLVIQATSNRVLSFDNVSDYTFSNKISDMFAQVATGVGLRKRQLYTDDGECVMCVSRMIIINGIDDVVTQSDLGSRTIGLKLSPVNVDNRISKREFSARLSAVQPKFFSAMVKVVSEILRKFDDVKITSGARMYDMIQWVTAGEEALGWEPGTFQTAYEINQVEVMESGLGEDPFAAGLISYMRNRPGWEGDATTLLSCLNAATDKGLRASKNWPRNAIMLGKGLTRIETSLRQLGIQISRTGRTASERVIQLTNHNLAVGNEVSLVDGGD